MHREARSLTRCVKQLQKSIASSALAANARCNGGASLERIAQLHSHSKFMEASSNIVNICEINSISIYDLKNEYERLKAKSLGEYKITNHFLE